MKQDSTCVALDDSKRTIVAGILRPGSDAPELRTLPNEPRHVRRFFARLQREGPVRVCYEAGPSGYDLFRQLTALDVPCQVLAPALTPRKPGDRIKTDRRDAAQRVRLFRAGELTPITGPDEAGEAARELRRCREDVQEDLLRWRHRLGKFLARHGHVYREGRNGTQRHWTWIRRQRFDLPALARTCEEDRGAVEQLLARVADLTREMAALAETEPYHEQGGGLRCFRGIDPRAAMTLLAEIGDFQRFAHPRQLMAYLGLVPSENSSGDRTQRGSITKAGNTHARRILVEACWHYRHPPRLGAALAHRSQGQPQSILAQAWRAQLRLHRRYRHLVGHGKRAPVAVVACARELVGFLWAVLTRVEASGAQAASPEDRADRGGILRHPEAARRCWHDWRALAVPWRHSGPGPGDSRE